MATATTNTVFSLPIKGRSIDHQLGVGMNTPGIIKYPFWRMTKQWKQAFYISVNLEQAWVPDDIMDRSLVLKADIAHVLEHLAGTDAGCNDGAGWGEGSCQP